MALMRTFVLSAAIFIFSSNRAEAAPLKTCIITGANRGVGYQAALQLAATNEWRVVMACRSEERGASALNSIAKGKENCVVEKLDLGDINSIKAFTTKWGSQNIDCLALNAGIQHSTSGFGGKEKGLNIVRTKQGFEDTVGTNHIGHFLLVKSLMKNVNKEKGRIVFVGSGVHNPEEGGGNVGSKATLGDFSGLKKGFNDPYNMVDGSDYDPDKSYKDSKLCNVMLTMELARRLKGEGSKVTVNVMNPGLIPTTGLFRDINPVFVAVFTFLTKYVFKVTSSEEEGGRRLAFLASSPSVHDLSGGYFTGKAGTSEFKPTSPSKEAADPTKGRMLYETTDTLLKKYL